VGHCAEVQEGEGHLFPCEPLERSVPVVPCVVASLHSRITLPVAWHWIVCCTLRVI